jgi:hypothetical protein
MPEQVDLTAGQQDYAIFLPAISNFYATFIGRQRHENHVDPARMPAQIPNMAQLNWLDPTHALFPYRWSLYSAGHSNLDLSVPDITEDMVRDRDQSSFVLGDSGGFQIAKGLWKGDWRDPNSIEVQQHLARCQQLGIETKSVTDSQGKIKTVRVDHVKEAKKKLKAAQHKRQIVLNWLDNIADYAMILDIPTWVIYNQSASEACGISTLKEAVEATKYNNEYFMQHRRGIEHGGARFLNVLQGENHDSADTWYDIMKGYCDPNLYPGRHFDGWAMGGQNMCDVHLILKRLVALRHDGLLQEGVHDWMHFLGTSKLEWAVLLTAIQRAVRRYVNPRFTISFDCASPFLATANGQVYHEIDLPHLGAWRYRMSPIVDDRKYSSDTRPFGAAVLADGLINCFEDSPVSSRFTMKDICVYRPGDVNRNGKLTKTSWDSFSYMLLMAHNVWTHIESVQRANRSFDSGTWPEMMWNQNGDHRKFDSIVDDIFSTDDRSKSEATIERYDEYWMDIIGTRGFKGKKAKNSRTQFNRLFSFGQS